jgi:hypothetical protein
MTILSNSQTQPMALEDMVVLDLTDEKGMLVRCWLIWGPESQL